MALCVASGRAHVAGAASRRRRQRPGSELPGSVCGFRRSTREQQRRNGAAEHAQAPASPQPESPAGGSQTETSSGSSTPSAPEESPPSASGEALRGLGNVPVLHVGRRRGLDGRIWGGLGRFVVLALPSALRPGWRSRHRAPERERLRERRRRIVRGAQEGSKSSGGTESGGALTTAQPQQASSFAEAPWREPKARVAGAAKQTCSRSSRRKRRRPKGPPPNRRRPPNRRPRANRRRRNPNPNRSRLRVPRKRNPNRCRLLRKRKPNRNSRLRLRRNHNVRRKRKSSAPRRKNAPRRRKQRATPKRKQRATPKKKQRAHAEEEAAHHAEAKQRTTPKKKQRTTPKKKQRTTPKKKQRTTPKKKQRTTPKKRQRTTPKKSAHHAEEVLRQEEGIRKKRLVSKNDTGEGHGRDSKNEPLLSGPAPAVSTASALAAEAPSAVTAPSPLVVWPEASRQASANPLAFPNFQACGRAAQRTARTRIAERAPGAGRDAGGPRRARRRDAPLRVGRAICARGGDQGNGVNGSSTTEGHSTEPTPGPGPGGAGGSSAAGGGSAAGSSATTTLVAVYFNVPASVMHRLGIAERSARQTFFLLIPEKPD